MSVDQKVDGSRRQLLLVTSAAGGVAAAAAAVPFVASLTPSERAKAAGAPVEVDIGKLAMWRIGTHSDLGGTWLSDYVENKLGGFSLTGTKKPDCPLIGQNGNIFNLMGIAARTLRHNGLAEQSKEIEIKFMATYAI